MSTFFGNIIGKLITGPTWEQKDIGNLLLTEVAIHRHGRRYKVSGMVVPKTKGKMDVAS